MKKRKRASKKRNFDKRKFWTGLTIIFLLIGAVITAMQTSFYGMAVGIIIGFLVSYLMNQL